MNSLLSYFFLPFSIICTATSTGDPAIFWGDYPPCEDNCHQSVWASQSCSLSNSCSCSGCLCLVDSCLCETSSWLIAVAQCIGEQCGSSAVTNAAYIAQSACADSGDGLAVPSAELVSIGLAAIPTTNMVQTTNSPVEVSVPQSTTVTPTGRSFSPVAKFIAGTEEMCSDRNNCCINLDRPTEYRHSNNVGQFTIYYFFQHTCSIYRFYACHPFS